MAIEPYTNTYYQQIAAVNQTFVSSCNAQTAGLKLERVIYRSRSDVSGVEFQLIKRFGASFIVDIDAVKQQVELVDRELDHGQLTAGPGKPTHLEPLQHQPEAGAVIEQQFYAIPFPVVEPEDGSRERIELHRLLDYRHHRVQPGAEVDWLAMQVNPQVVVEAEHQPAPNATIIVLTSGASCIEHPRLITTPLGNRTHRHACGGADIEGDSRRTGNDSIGAVDRGAALAIVTTGTNAEGSASMVRAEPATTPALRHISPHLRS